MIHNIKFRAFVYEDESIDDYYETDYYGEYYDEYSGYYGETPYTDPTSDLSYNTAEVV